MATTSPVRLDEFRCPKCGAANRGRVMYVELTQEGRLLCAVCGKDSAPPEPA
jgi:transcription elongation factor Elf1